MTTIVCPACKGAGKVRISWFKKKICFRCKGSGYVHILSTPVRRTIQSTSSQDDGAPALDFTHSDNLNSPSPVEQTETFEGKGGEFGGAGASAHWGDSQSNSNCGSDSSSSSSSSDSSSSSCSSDSGSSSGGGD